MFLTKKQNNYVHFLFLFLLSKLFIFCHHYSGQSVSLQVNAPNFNSKNYSSNYTSFAIIQIPIQITNSNGFNLQTTLNSGANNIQIPIGSIHIKIGYLAMGIKSSKTICNNNSSNNNGSEDNNEVLYTEFESNYSINGDTSSININFPKPFTEIEFDHFGFTVTDSSGNPATNAQIYYLDPISNQKLTDPCNGTAFNDTADTLGKIAVDLPVYNNAKQFNFLVISNDGTTKTFQATLIRESSTAQFYFMKMTDGSMTAMNDQTDSFLGDGYTIAQRRDTLLRNPRFPDFSSVTLNPPDYTTGQESLYPNNSQTSNSNDLINKRKFTIYCQIIDSNSYPVPPFTSNFQICNYYYPDIGLTTSPNLSIGAAYTLKTYYTDTEGFCPISTPYGCSSASPVSILFNYKTAP